MLTSVSDTRDASYARRLRDKEGVWWKRLLNVQAPYRWNVRRQQLGRTLDVGCGIGRNLGSLPTGSVGVDHNADSVTEARRRGYTVLTTEEWEASPLRVPGSFDSLLLAHVIEHLDEAAGRELVRAYLPYLRRGGRVFVVCPQERGYATDATHVRFTDLDDLSTLAREVGLTPVRSFSFPFPRWVGRFFAYNEFCLLAADPTS